MGASFEKRACLKVPWDLVPLNKSNILAFPCYLVFYTENEHDDT